MDSDCKKKLAGSAHARGREEDEYEKAMRQALSGKPFLHSDGKYLTREEIHDRDRHRAEEKTAREGKPARAPER